jgi:hypothetical protein
LFFVAAYNCFVIAALTKIKVATTKQLKAARKQFKQ